jgi:cytochrome P450
VTGGEAIAPPPTVFDPSLLRDNSLSARATQFLLNHPARLFAVLRRVRPILRIGGFVVVTRRDDVEEALSNPDAFQSRLAPRLADLHPDAPNAPVFKLGTDGPGHAESLRSVSQAMRMTDLPRIGEILRRFVEPRVAGQFALDAGELTRLAQTHLGCRYLGLDVDPTAIPRFALCCLALGNYVLGAQAKSSTQWLAGRGAAAEVSAVIRRSIATARLNGGTGTVLHRLLDQHVDDATIEATLSGLLFGLVGGGTTAATHALQILLERPRAMRAAQETASAGDDVALGRVLLEALRLRPIVPVVFRDCTTDSVIAGGTRRSLQVRKGELVAAAVQSAMADPRWVATPDAFNPNRPAADSMVFGFGLHSCVGFAIGRTQLVETLKPLLRRRIVQSQPDRRATTYFGTTPETLRVQLS